MWRGRGSWGANVQVDNSNEKPRAPPLGAQIFANLSSDWSLTENASFATSEVERDASNGARRFDPARREHHRPLCNTDRHVAYLTPIIITTRARTCAQPKTHAHICTRIHAPLARAHTHTETPTDADRSATSTLIQKIGALCDVVLYHGTHRAIRAKLINAEWLIR